MDINQLCNGASLSLTQRRLVDYNAKDIANLLGDIRSPGLDGLLKVVKPSHNLFIYILISAQLSHSCPGCDEDLTHKSSSERVKHFLLGACKNTETGKSFLILMGRSEELAGPLIELCCEVGSQCNGHVNHLTSKTVESTTPVS
jgi:hypothetical protein